MRLPLKRSLVAGAAALSLSGCAFLGGGSQPLDTYDLSAPQVTDAGRRLARVQVLVTEPSALKSFDGENIVVKPSPSSIEYLKGAQWSDRLPKVVQARLAETFQKSRRFGGVGKPGEGLAIDYRVVVDIRSFAIRLGGAPRADVELYVRLLNDRTGVVRAEKLFSSGAPVSGEGNAAFVWALDAAFRAAAADILDWSTSVM